MKKTNIDDMVEAEDCNRPPGYKCRVPPGMSHSLFYCLLDEMDPTHDLSFRGLTEEQAREKYGYPPKED